MQQLQGTVTIQTIFILFSVLNSIFFFKFLSIFSHIVAWEMKILNIIFFLFLLLHRACCRVTQLLHQPLHIYKIYKIYTLKH